MPITAECPQCGFKGSVPDQFKGKKVKCRQCANFFRVGGEQAAAPSKNGSAESRKTCPALDMEIFEDISSPPVRKAKPSSQAIELPAQDEGSAPPRKARPSAQGVKPAPKDDSSAFAGLGDEEPAPPPRRPSRGSSHGDEPVRKKGAGRNLKKKSVEPASPVAIVLGAMAIVLSGVALAVGSMGMVGLISVPLSGLALLLSIGGVVMAWGRPGFRILAPVGGTLLSLVALPVAGWFTYKLIDSGVLSDKPDNNAQAQATSGESSSSPDSTQNGETPKDSRPDTRTGPPDTKPVETKKETPIGEAYMDAGRGEKATLGPVSLQVSGVEIDPKEKRLLVRLSLQNTSGEQDVDYEGWGTTDNVPPPVLTDNRMTNYERIVLTGAAKVEGQIDAQTLKPQKGYGDIVVFQVPSDQALFLHLELPASYMETKGKKMQGAFKFKIPKSMLLGKGPLPPDKEPKKDPPKDIKKYIADRMGILNNPKSLQPQQVNALKELGELGGDGAPAAPSIAIILSDKNRLEHVRVAAAEALGAMGAPASAQVPALIKAVSTDEFPLTRIAAAKALGQMKATADSAIPALKEQMKNKDMEIAAAARRAILQINPKEDLPPLPKK